jgi:thioredoxin 1
MLAPVFSGLAEQYPDITFEVIDVDQHPDIADAHDIRNVPTIMILKDGKIVDTLIGANSKQIYEKAIKEHI